MRKILLITALLVCVLSPVAFAGDSQVQTNKADIVFFIDSSGSMYEEITGVKDNVLAFSESLTQKGVDGRFAIIDFHDHDNRVIDFSGSHWTTSAQNVKNELSAISLGGDECIPRALDTVTSWDDFRNDAIYFGFLLTDEPTTDGYSYPEKTTEQVISDLKSKQIQVTAITKQSYKEHYRDLYSTTGGVWIDIDRPDYYKTMLDLASWISETVLIPSADRLPYSEIDTVSATGSMISSIASEAGITADSIDVLTTETSAFYDTSLPHDLSPDLREAIETSLDITFLTKINTVILYSETLSKDEWGYFLFRVVIPDDPSLDNIAIANSTKFEAKSDTDGFLDFMIFDTDGKKLSTLNTKDILLLIYGKTEACITPYFVKSNVDGALRFWITNAAEFGDYATKNRASVLETLMNRLKEIIDDITGGNGGGGGCDAGVGVLGLALVGMLLKRR